MSRSRKPARLWLRRGFWVILDDGKQHSTGCAESDHAGASEALARYLAEKHASQAVGKNLLARQVAIADVLAHYATVRGRSVSRPEELARRIDNLAAWWGTMTLDDITSRTCLAYAESRSTMNQARRELEDLRSAINLAIADNITRQSVKVTLPPKARGRVQFLERDLMAKLIWAAYRKREFQRGRPTKKRPTLHVARFILTALYTGSRSARVWMASFEQEEGRPWVDLERGVFYRAPHDEDTPLNKRAPPIRVPPRLLSHMRRWRAKGAKYVVEYKGKPGDPKRAFRNLVDDVLGTDAAGIVRHTLRHTAATYLMQEGVDPLKAAQYLGMTLEMMERNYVHHHPDHQAEIGVAFSRAKRRNR